MDCNFLGFAWWLCCEEKFICANDRLIISLQCITMTCGFHFTVIWAQWLIIGFPEVRWEKCQGFHAVLICTIEIFCQLLVRINLTNTLVLYQTLIWWICLLLMPRLQTNCSKKLIFQNIRLNLKSLLLYRSTKESFLCSCQRGQWDQLLFSRQRGFGGSVDRRALGWWWVWLQLLWMLNGLNWQGQEEGKVAWTAISFDKTNWRG